MVCEAMRCVVSKGGMNNVGFSRQSFCPLISSLISPAPCVQTRRAWRARAAARACQPSAFASARARAIAGVPRSRNNTHRQAREKKGLPFFCLHVSPRVCTWNHRIRFIIPPTSLHSLTYRQGAQQPPPAGAVKFHDVVDGRSLGRRQAGREWARGGRGRSTVAAHFFPLAECVTGVLVLRSKGRRAVRSQAQESGHSLVRGRERLARVGRARARGRERVQMALVEYM